MESYGRFAGVYDVFMDNVNYREWADYIIETLAQDGIRDGLVLELGCGTGTVTEMLADAGYDMIGIDNSEEMLAEAMEKRAESGHDILYLLQDMQDFELYGTVRAVISVCDSMNYLTDEEDLEYLFALVNNYLDPGGLFIFDMNTIHKYRDVIGDTTIAEDREDGSFIWENSYDSPAVFNFTPNASTPNVLYFQSYANYNMGNKIHIVDDLPDDLEDFVEEPYQYEAWLKHHNLQLTPRGANSASSFAINLVAIVLLLFSLN